MMLSELPDKIRDALVKFVQSPMPPLTTPFVRSNYWSTHTGTSVWLKLESEQHTGSFKYRGAMAKILALTAAQKNAGIITASSGNHGYACATAASAMNLPLTVFVPQDASTAKCQLIKAKGANLIKVSGDCLAAELLARQKANESGATFISPYNDWDIVAGQGTCGLEMLQQGPELDAIFIAVGGGGLISGIGSVFKQNSPSTEIIGCWPENATSMSACLTRGEIIEIEESPTLSEGTAGGVEPGSITFELCQSVIDKHILVSEEAIASAMRRSVQYENRIIEGAAGVALAAMEQVAQAYKDKRVGVVICGRNVAFDTLMSVLINDTVRLS